MTEGRRKTDRPRLSLLVCTQGRPGRCHWPLEWPWGTGQCWHTHSTARTLQGAHITGHTHGTACSPTSCPPNAPPRDIVPAPTLASVPWATLPYKLLLSRECITASHKASEGSNCPKFRGPWETHRTVRLRGGGLDSRAPSTIKQSLGPSTPSGQRGQVRSLTLTEQLETWGAGEVERDEGWHGPGKPILYFFKTVWVE